MKQVIKRNQGWSFLILSLILSLFFINQGHAAQPRKKTINLCQASGKNMLQSGLAQVRSDYWLALAKADNIPNPGKKKEAQNAAKKKLEEDIELSEDQYEARLELCEDLKEEYYQPEINPDHFVDYIDNPYLPLVPGMVFVYEKETAEGLETIHFEVTQEKKEILGVNCAVVRDIVHLEGVVVEDTFDYFAQDQEGNVWYFGELSKNYENGELTDLAGSWIGGVDDAQPGILMKANPQIGETYRQEFFLGEAEDVAGIRSLSESTQVPFGNFINLLETEDYTPITPGANEFKFYHYGTGLVLVINPETGERTELVDIQYHP